MEAICKVKYVRQSPYKVRFVADMIRGKKVADAINILNSTNKKASSFLIKSLKSAIANIIFNDDANFDNDELYIKSILIDGCPTIKRFIISNPELTLTIIFDCRLFTDLSFYVNIKCFFVLTNKLFESHLISLIRNVPSST